MNTFRKFVVLFLFIMLNNNALIYAQDIEHIEAHSYEGYLFPRNHLIAGLFPIANGCNLNISQINKSEKIIGCHINNLKRLCPDKHINKRVLKKYKRQYWGTISKKGHIIVNIYLISSDLADYINLEEDIINMCDGGCDFIYIMVDIEEETIVIKPNGVA